VVVVVDKEKDWRRLACVCEAIYEQSAVLDTNQRLFRVSDERIVLEVGCSPPYASVFLDLHRPSWTFCLESARPVLTSDYAILPWWIVGVLRGLTQKSWRVVKKQTWGVVTTRAYVDVGRRVDTFTTWEFSFRRRPLEETVYLPWPRRAGRTDEGEASEDG
jgi:hypothetical protein